MCSEHLTQTRFKPTEQKQRVNPPRAQRQLRKPKQFRARTRLRAPVELSDAHRLGVAYRTATRLARNNRASNAWHLPNELHPRKGQSAITRGLALASIAEPPVLDARFVVALGCGVARKIAATGEVGMEENLLENQLRAKKE